MSRPPFTIRIQPQMAVYAIILGSTCAYGTYIPPLKKRKRCLTMGLFFSFLGWFFSHSVHGFVPSIDFYISIYLYVIVLSWKFWIPLPFLCFFSCCLLLVYVIYIIYIYLYLKSIPLDSMVS